MTYHTSEIEAEIRDSPGTMPNPMTVLAATSEAKLLEAAAQKLVTIMMTVQRRYTGLLPYLTANALMKMLPTALEAIMLWIPPTND